MQASIFLGFYEEYLFHGDNCFYCISDVRNAIVSYEHGSLFNYKIVKKNKFFPKKPSY